MNEILNVRIGCFLYLLGWTYFSDLSLAEVVAFLLEIARRAFRLTRQIRVRSLLASVPLVRLLLEITHVLTQLARMQVLAHF